MYDFGLRKPRVAGGPLAQDFLSHFLLNTRYMRSAVSPAEPYAVLPRRSARCNHQWESTIEAYVIEHLPSNFDTDSSRRLLIRFFLVEAN